MLVDTTIVIDTLAAKIAAMVNTKNTGFKRLEKGIYEIGHFSLNHCLIVKYESYPNIEDLSDNVYFGEFGVCDNYKQILEQCPGLITSDRKFIISVTPILKKEQSDWGGWRWHKWGEYIGNQKPTTEYIYDEPEIEKVYVYHIYELI
jgi:hypothetical protein